MALAQRRSLQPAPAPRPDAPQRHLRALPKVGANPQATGTLGLVIIAIVAVLGIFATQLWLSVATSQGAYTANDLILEERELARIERVMQQEVFVVSSPQNLSQKASEQGMVQNARPAFLELEASVVKGELAQSSTATKANTVPNAALTDFNTPLEVKLAKERAAAELAAQEAAAAEASAAEAAASETAEATTAQGTTTAGEAEKSQEPAVPETPKPTGPVAWSDALPAPSTR